MTGVDSGTPTDIAAGPRHTHPGVQLAGAQVFAAGPEFQHEALLMTLPDDTATPGVTTLVGCHAGFRKDDNYARVRGLRTIAAGMPAGQEVVTKRQKIQTDAGNKAWVESWKGSVDIGGGQVVVLRSELGVVHTDHCWLSVLSFASENAAEKAQEDFMALVNSAR